ncbi:MAG: hypothetical protein AAB459_01440 [Patescibacteria group bacterium]
MPPQNKPFSGPGISAPLQPHSDVSLGPPPKKGMNKLIIPFVLTLILFLGSLAFAFYAYGGMIDYKKNSDKKADKAVAIAVEKAKTAKDNEFTEKEKSPYKEYKGPSELGSVAFSYPKTWSAHVSEKGTGNSQLNGYLHPNFVPALDTTTAFALRIEVVNRTLAEELKSIDGKIKSGKVSSAPYSAPKVSGALGSRLTGEVTVNPKTTMILLPTRDKTIKIWTESDQFVADLYKIILATLTFSP